MTARTALAVSGVLAAIVLAGCTSPSTTPPTAASPTPSVSETRSAATAAPQPSSSPTTQDTHNHDESVDDEDHYGPPQVPVWDATAQTQVVARAEGFVTAWARPDLDTQTWLAGVEGFLAPAATEMFAWTDPAFIPASEVTGRGVLVQGSATTATVDVPTDAGTIRVDLVHTDDQTPWQVATVTAIGE